MNSSSATSPFPLMRLVPEMRSEVIAHLPMTKSSIRNVALVCKALREDAAPYKAILQTEGLLAWFNLVPLNQRKAAQLEKILARLPMSLPSIVLVPRVCTLADSLSTMAAAEAAAALRHILQKTVKLPKAEQTRMELRAMSANLAAHHGNAHNNIQTLVPFLPANEKEAGLVAQYLLSQSYEDFAAARATPGRHALAIDLHTQALAWAAAEPDAERRFTLLGTLTSNIVELLFDSDALKNHPQQLRGFVTSLVALIPKQTVKTQARLLYYAFRLENCVPGLEATLIKLVQNLLLDTHDEALKTCWKEVCDFAWIAQWEGHEELQQHMLDRTLAIKEPVQKSKALDTLAKAAWRHGNQDLMARSMQVLCGQVPPTLDEIRTLLNRLDTPVTLKCRATMTPGHPAGMITLMSEYNRIDVKQLFMREILPRLRALPPQERMLAATEVSQVALSDFDSADAYSDFKIFYRAMLEAVFHDVAQWTPEQQDDRTTLKTLRAQVDNPQRPHLLYPESLPDAARQILDKY